MQFEIQYIYLYIIYLLLYSPKKDNIVNIITVLGIIFEQE